jgi:hypothetical protein
MAYLIGPKNVEWTPIANRATSISGMATAVVSKPCQASSSPAAPTTMMAISAALTRRMIRALSRMSASCPASAERTKNGRMNRPEAMAENCASSSAER